LDKAIADGLPVDVSKPFLPFGPQPQAGAAFYFTNDETFSRPGARVQVFVQMTASGVTPGTGEAPVPHAVAWEYWNGADWLALLTAAGTNTGAPEDFTASGVLSNDLIVPDDMAVSRVGN